MGGNDTRESARDAVMALIMYSERPTTIRLAPKGSAAAAPPRKGTSGGATAPVLIREDPLARIWHKMDASFRTPKTNLYLDITAPVVYYEPASACLARLFFRLLSDELSEFVYRRRALLDLAARSLYSRRTAGTRLTGTLPSAQGSRTRCTAPRPGCAS